MSAVWLYAGNSEYPAVLVHCHTRFIGWTMSSENPSGADNQQERQGHRTELGGGLRRRRRLLHRPIVRITSVPTSAGRSSPSSRLTQGAREHRMYSRAQAFFGAAQSSEPTARNHSERLYRFAVERRADLRDAVVRSSSNTRCDGQSETTFEASSDHRDSCEKAGTSTADGLRRDRCDCRDDEPPEAAISICWNPQRPYAEPSHLDG